MQFVFLNGITRNQNFGHNETKLKTYTGPITKAVINIFSKIILNISDLFDKKKELNSPNYYYFSTRKRHIHGP